jgi:hypothetical protein
MTDTVQTKLLSLPDFAQRSNAFHQAALAYGKLLLEGGYDESKVADYLHGQIDFVAQLLRSSGDGVPQTGATLPSTLPSSARRETDSTRQREGGNVSFEVRLDSVRALLRTRGT